MAHDDHDDRDDRDELRPIAEELFGTFNQVPFAYVRELRRYLHTATAKVALLDSHHHAAHWITGRSLGTLTCTGVVDGDITGQPLVCQFIRLDRLTALDVGVGVNYDNGIRRIRSQGRRLIIGEHVDLDASPGRYLPEKRSQIEAFIDAVLAVVAG